MYAIRSYYVIDYLADCGVPRARVVTGPDADPGLTLRPFGWNAEAIALNRQAGEPARSYNFV